MTAAAPALDASTLHLARRLGAVEARVRTAIAWRREHDLDPDDPFRGLYINDAHVDHLLGAPPGPIPADARSAALLAAAERDAATAKGRGEDVRLEALARAFGLDDVDVDLLLVALAPDVDARFEKLYGYLNDDVSRRRASVGLALELCQVPLVSGPGRARLGPGGALRAGGLLVVEDEDRPFLTRGLRVPDRVAGHLLGDDVTEPSVAVLRYAPFEHPDLPADPVCVRRLEAANGPCYLRERNGAAGAATAAAAVRSAGLDVLALDVRQVASVADVAGLAAVAAREARLVGAGLVVGPVDDLDPAAIRVFADAPCPIVLIGARAWDPTWSRRPAVVVDAPVPTPEARTALWRAALGADIRDEAPAAAVAAFRLSPEQVASAAASASATAAAHQRLVDAADLQAGARSQNAAGLERLARRVEPDVAWDDLILPADALQLLQELTARARHRDLVLDTWRMGTSSARGRGVTALFAGGSGTGKTLSAEVVAADLGLDLYVIDLSSVIDKYIGETEKNLDRIFGEADRVNGVLLFDEADALFGKRSEVGDSRDRYANVEVAYLLQRMERFDGVAVLTTNLRSNVDEAFTRRLDTIVDFPDPDEEDRLRLWGHKLAPLPIAADVDLSFLARAFRLSGGEIRNAAVTAAYLAASQDRSVGMADLVRAVEREYRKLGRMCVESEFGAYFPLLTEV
jgi:hypothetical protein